MPRYLIDANLPRWFSLWNSAEYVHQHDIDPAWHDVQIWEYAKQNGLTIVTKDSDFSSRILLLGPPPKVIHIRLGNMDMRGFHEALDGCWAEVLETSASHKLVVVYENRIHAIV
jgi:predicted nuclease of predicted toxin-antitoxin system